MTFQSSKSAKVLVSAAVFSLAFLYLYWIVGDILRTAGDEGIYLEGGRLIALGRQPYRDFFVLTGPLTFWIEGVLAGLSGMSLAVMRIPVVLDAAFLAWAAYWFTSRYTARFYAVCTAFALLADESRNRLLNVNHRWDSSALATAAAVAALGAHRTGRLRLWAVSGFLVAAAAWATPSMLIAGLPLLLWSARKGVRGVLAFLGGGTLATVPAAIYLAAHHALIPMIQCLRWTSANYTAANTVGYGSVWVGAPVGGLHRASWNYALASILGSVPAVLPLAAIAGWVWFSRSGRDRAETGETLPLAAVAAALVLSEWPRWSADALIHTMALSWALCAILLYRLTSPRQRFWCCGVALLAAGISVGSKALAPFSYSPRETRVGALRDPDDEGEFLSRLENWIQPGDSLFSFPYLPSAYFFLNARNPSRYSFMQPGMMNAEDEHRAVEELRAAPPRWVLYERFPADAVLAIWPGSDPSLIPMRTMNTYIAEHYRPVDTVSGIWGTLEVMQQLPPAP
jgi:hypothetical protein